MRKFIVCALVVAGCGSSAKKATHAGARDNDRAGASSVAQPSRPSSGDATIVTNTGEDLSWLAPVYFQFDSAELTPATRDTLARLHDWMAMRPKVTVTIEGHCDEQGTTEYNIGLGQRRAQAMVDYLARLGTPASRLTPVSYGAERPAVDGHDEVAWSKNRRGEFRLAR